MGDFRAVYNILWGDIIRIPLPGGSTLGLSLLVLDSGSGGTLFYDTDAVPAVPAFPGDAESGVWENNKKIEHEGISGVQALIVSTACRVGMGNLVGVVPAISAGGAGAVFWMWVIALVGSSTGIYRGDSGAALQGERSALRRLSGRSRHIIFIICL